jgi:3-hydroxybutyryl-CoA dehydrogenase
MEIRKVGVVGCGLMGGGIAQVCAQSGFATVAPEVSRELLDEDMAGVVSRLARDVAKGKLIPHSRDVALSLLAPATTRDAFADRQIVIEAIVENLDAKPELYAALDALCLAETIFASNHLLAHDYRDGRRHQPARPFRGAAFLQLAATHRIF